MDLPYRQGVYSLILNKNNEILLVHKKKSNMWDFPGGGIDEGETHNQALQRELQEELGIVNDYEVLYRGTETLKYDWPESEKQKNFDKSGIWRRGQEQTYFVLRFSGLDSEIVLQPEELTEFKWVPLQNLKEFMTYPEQYAYIQSIFDEFNANKLS